MVFGGVILFVGILAGLAINAAWNAYREPRTGSGAAVPSTSRSVAPVSAATPPLRPVRLVHASLGDDLTGPQTAAAADVALRNLVQWVASGTDAEVEALVLTGSFGAPGVDPAATVKRLFEILKDAPAGIPIYVVPGGRPLGAGETLTAALKADTDVILELQKQLQSNPAGPRAMIDLSECYRNAAADGSGCVARPPGRQVRFVGYPAYPLPTLTPSATPNEALAKEQEQWRGIFQKAIALNAGANTVLISPLTTPVASHWTGVNQAAWMAIARSARTAMGVDAAGTRLRPAYEADEPWTESGLEGRWLLAPPLLTANGGDRGAAQGASLVTIAADGTLAREVFWYEPPALAFRASVAAPPPGPSATGWLGRVTAAAAYLWRLGNTLEPLPRASMFFIALLAAFLTVAAVWQIPPATTGTVTITTPAAAGTPQAGTTVAIPQALMDKWAPASLLQQNLSRTVLSGLGGLAVATLTLETVGQANKSDAQAYYLVWFVVWFLLFLFLSSAIRSGVEGLRALAYVGRQQPVPSASVGVDLKRLLRWLPSVPRLRWFAIVASDAFFNLVQGKNELQNIIWAGEIRNLHEDVILAIDRVAEHLRAGIFEFLTTQTIPVDPPVAGGPAPQNAKPQLADVRVAVSLMSEDQKSVYYVSWPIESSAKEFGPNSVAYVAVAGGATRWWIDGMEKDATIVLYDNTAGELTQLPKQQLILKDYFASRARDYKSFALFPIPSRPADAVGKRAGLHISFKHKNALRVLWGNATSQGADCFARHAEMLDSTPPELERLFRQSIHVMESVLRSFNEEVFKGAMRSRRRS